MWEWPSGYENVRRTGGEIAETGSGLMRAIKVPCRRRLEAEMRIRGVEETLYLACVEG